MANIKPVRCPVEYIYLDSSGIESLYAQIVDSVETAHTTTIQKGLAARAGGGLRFKNFLVKLLSGLEAEVSTEVTGSGTRTEQSTRVHLVENRLERVLEFLSGSGEGHYFTDLGEAARALQAGAGPAFINIQDRFNAPQFYGSGLGVDAVNADGYLLLEKGGAADYHDGDDYYKQPTAPVKLSASIKKMRNGGPMAATSHEAEFIRGLAGRHVPLCVFGTLAGTSDYLQIKPFAIWK
jgi:hypothetical protein